MFFCSFWKRNWKILFFFLDPRVTGVKLAFNITKRHKTIELSKKQNELLKGKVWCVVCESFSQTLSWLVYWNLNSSIMDAFRKIYPTEFYKKFLLQQVRPDGRSIHGIRKTTISQGSTFNTSEMKMNSNLINFLIGSITTAHGSSFVRMGNTSVVCGIKGEVALATQNSDSDPRLSQFYCYIFSDFFEHEILRFSFVWFSCEFGTFAIVFATLQARKTFRTSTTFGWTPQ